MMENTFCTEITCENEEENARLWSKVKVGPGWYKLITNFDSMIKTLGVPYEYKKITRRSGRLYIKYRLEATKLIHVIKARQFAEFVEKMSLDICEACGQEGSLTLLTPQEAVTLCDTCLDIYKA